MSTPNLVPMLRKAAGNLLIVLCLALVSAFPGQSATDTYTIYDDQSSFITYNGSWSQASSGFSKAWNTSDHWTNSQGASASLTFTAGSGGSITYVYTMHNNRGVANVISTMF